VIAALVLFAWRRFRREAWLLLFVGVSHLSTRLIAGVSKNVFLRARPAEAVVQSGWQDRFFIDGGSSFPSGHAAHFWALFFAVALAFPKLRIPAFLLAVFVSVARVAVNDHYASDVLASAAIAALVSYAFARLILPRATRLP
jgi:membrane-associated phospholipid phosphatase